MNPGRRDPRAAMHRPFCLAVCTAIISRPDPESAVTRFLGPTTDTPQ